jgi:glycerol-3-phosphate acyltransferase PlsX
MKIIVDAMGGDNAPEAIVAGAVRALRQNQDLEILLAGPEERLRALKADAGDVTSRIGYIPAAEVIAMDEAPMLAVRRKADSSMVQATLAVKDGRAQAMVSAGSTGAVLACGMFRLGRIQGIERPALAILFPGVQKPFLLLDCGANADCQSKYLDQFGLMGSVYMQSVQGVQDPAVGLVNIGTEEEKGNRLAKETYARMSAQTSYRFAGNVEAREVPTGSFDVVVADGFTGNVIVKYTEGLIGAFMDMLKSGINSPARKAGALLMKPAFRELKHRMDYNRVGGAPLLGVDGVMVKAHGASGEVAMCSAILQAQVMARGGVTEKIREGLSGLSDDGNGGEEA